MHLASSLGSPAVWVHPQGGRLYPGGVGGGEVRLDEVTVPRLWEAILRAGRRARRAPLGEIVAEELATELGTRIAVEEEASGLLRPVVARTPGLRCPGDPGNCLLALLAKALVGRGDLEGLALVGCLWSPEGTCEVLLGRGGREAEGSGCGETPSGG